MTITDMETLTKETVIAAGLTLREQQVILLLVDGVSVQDMVGTITTWNDKRPIGRAMIHMIKNKALKKIAEGTHEERIAKMRISLT
jgi:hypothetical protein